MYHENAALKDFNRFLSAWDAALVEKLNAEERGDADAAEQHGVRADEACEAMLEAQQRVSEQDIYALALIARAHNPDLDAKTDGIDFASIGRLIDACLALGEQQRS